MRRTKQATARQSPAWIPQAPLVISMLDTLKPQLLEAMDRAEAAGKPIDLDLSQQEQADTAGIQFLLAAQREAMRRGMQFRITAMAESLAGSIRRLGLGAALKVG